MAFRDLKTTTIREFDGGLNVVNDDLNMNKKYSTVEENVYYSNHGNKAKRFGTKFLKDLKKFDIVSEDFIVDSYSEDDNLILYDNLNSYPKTGNEVLVVYTPYSYFQGTTLLDVTESFGIVDSVQANKIIIKNTTNRIIQGTVKSYKIKLQSSTEKQNFYYDLSLDKPTDDGITYKEFEFPYKKPKNIVKGSKITIKSATQSAFVDKTFTVYEVISNNDYIKQIHLQLNDVSVGTDVVVTDTTNLWSFKLEDEDKIRTSFSDKYENGSYYTAKFEKSYSTVLEHLENNSDLIVGHKINYNNAEYILKDVQTSYRTNQNDTEYLAVFYHLNMKLTDEDKNRKKVSVTHDNRNIKGTKIVNCDYFLDKIIAVSDFGEVVMIDAQQNASIIWNETIAYTLNSEKDIEPWRNVEDCCFCIFNGIMTIWNGKDKPLAIELKDTIGYRPCNFLYDIGKGSNANVPRAKYAIGFNHYLVCANIIDDNGDKHEDRIMISMRDSIATFYDFSGKDDVKAGNDSVWLDMGTIVTTNEQKITGLFRYRDKLVVGFKDVTVLGTLGTYEPLADDETIKMHVPNFEDIVNDSGCLCNKSYKSIGNEVVCIDFSGVPMFQRTGIYSIVQPARISNLIKPEIFPKFNGLTENQIENNIFSIHNPKENQYMLFIPTKFDEKGNQLETTCYVYTVDNKIKASTLGGAWSKFTGWNFNCGCTSALKNVFLFEGTKLYLLGTSDNPFYADFIDDPDYPDEDGKLTGKEINFVWEFPWADFGDRSATKHSRYLAISSTGNSDFSIDFFTDYIYYNNYYKKLDPSLTLNFLAGDSHGWGNGKQSYGGGRITNNEQLFAWTTKFKIGKFRIHGASKDKLNINSITLYYQMGNIRR